MIKYLFLILTPIFLFAQKTDYRYEGWPYYPEQYLDKTDSLKWPLTIDIAIDVKDIKELDEKKDNFFSKLVVSSYSKYDFEYISVQGDTVDLAHSGGLFYVDYKENSLTSEIEQPDMLFKRSEYDYLFYDGFFSKSVKLLEAPFDHNWDLRNFPFDKQTLEIYLVNRIWPINEAIISVSDYTKRSLEAFEKRNDIVGWNIVGNNILTYLSIHQETQ